LNCIIENNVRNIIVNMRGLEHIFIKHCVLVALR
jgi:hypothetical protein